MAYTSNTEKFFYAKLDDGITLCERRHKPYFFSFLTEREQMLAERYMVSLGFCRYAFFGGYAGAERQMLGIFSNEEEEAFPLCALELTFRKSDKLTHRDFLGALMSLGIERETIGDILVEDGRCIIFVKEEIASFIRSQLFKVGNAGIKISDADTGFLPKGRGCDERLCTVSSLRLDAVVAAATGVSREKAKQLVVSGSVSHNYEPCQNISRLTAEKDVLTIRGKGKYVINGVQGETKKHRIKLSMIHYR